MENQNTEKIYVVMKTDGRFEDAYSEIIYAGTNEETARTINTDSFTRLDLGVWICGKLVQSFVNFDTNGWELQYDMIQELQKQQDELKSKLENVKNDISKISSLM